MSLWTPSDPFYALFPILIRFEISTNDQARLLHLILLLVPPRASSSILVLSHILFLLSKSLQVNTIRFFHYNSFIVCMNWLSTVQTIVQTHNSTIYYYTTSLNPGYCVVFKVNIVSFCLICFVVRESSECQCKKYVFI